MKVRRGASSIKVMGILVGKLKLNPEVKPRSGQWYVISMEFLRSFLRRHFAGKPVVASRNVGYFPRLGLFYVSWIMALFSDLFWWVTMIKAQWRLSVLATRLWQPEKSSTFLQKLLDNSLKLDIFLVNKLLAYCEIHVSCLKLMSHGKFICDWIFFSQ